MNLVMTRAAVIVIALVALCASPLSMARSPGERKWSLAVGVGRTFPGSHEFIDDGNTLGVQGGYTFNQRVDLTGSLGYSSFDDDLGSPWEGSLDVDSVTLDFGVGYFFFPDKRFSIVPFGGLGVASFKVDGTIVNGNTGTVRGYGDDDDEVDQELSIAFGWTFGK